MGWLRVGFMLLLCAHGLACLASSGPCWLLGNVDFLIHEAGHLIFGLFLGEFVGVLGGTLMQLLMPVAFTTYFLFFRHDLYAACVTGVWLAENLFGSVAPYIADARARLLPLHGGPYVIHDWNYLLGKVGLLEWDRVIAGMVRVTGVLLFAVSVVVGAVGGFPGREAPTVEPLNGE